MNMNIGRDIAHRRQVVVRVRVAEGSTCRISIPGTGSVGVTQAVRRICCQEASENLNPRTVQVTLQERWAQLQDDVDALFGM